METKTDKPHFLPHILEGPHDSENLLIFLHGYPDNMDLWEPMVENLKPDYRCLRISYPNFSSTYKEKWGIDFEVLLVKIKELIDFVDPKGLKKKTFVMHDFGALIGFFFDEKYPGYLYDIVSLDIGLGRDTKPISKFIFAFCFTILYQMYLLIAFIIGGFIGKYMTMLFLSLIIKSGYRPSNYKEIDSSFNYMYYYLIKRMILGMCNNKKKILNNYKPSCPMAFIFGLNKPFMFHSEQFLRSLMEKDKCEVHGVKGGHWVMLKYKELILDVIKRRAK